MLCFYPDNLKFKDLIQEFPKTHYSIVWQKKTWILESETLGFKSQLYLLLAINWDKLRLLSYFPIWQNTNGTILLTRLL